MEANVRTAIMSLILGILFSLKIKISKAERNSKILNKYVPSCLQSGREKNTLTR